MAAGGEHKKKRRPEKRSADDGSKLRKPVKKARKEATYTLSAPAELPTSLLVEADDPDFPRGGGSLLSRQEEEDARAEAEAQFEREESYSRKGKGKARKKKGLKGSSLDFDNDLGSLFGDGITGKLPRFANRITLKNISARMKLWGVIVEVNRKDLVISLPGGLRGFVHAEEVIDIPLSNGDKVSEGYFLSGIFHVGQLVPCVVLRVDDDKKDGKGNKRIWLSLRLSLLHKGLTLDAIQDGMVLNAQVKSVEDHGYILFFGVSSFTGFLPKNERDGDQIFTGQIMQCVVKDIDKARAVVHVDSDSDLVSKFIIKDLKGLSIDLLVPGMMVNARVRSILENGIMVSFLTYFTGTVDIFHLENTFPGGAWKDNYNQNKKVNARILFIDPSTRAVGLTLNKYLIDNKAPPAYVQTGEIYDNSQILRVDRGLGFLLEIRSSPAHSPAYVSIHDASDEVLKPEKKFKEGDFVRVRILGMRYLEGLATGTMKASAFEGSVFTHSDVKPGMLVKSKVIAVENFGAIVQFPSGVKALCPLPHMSELEIVKPPKKFKVGAELLFRVLGCKSKRITVTYKKSLIKSKLDVLASYGDAAEGLVTHGWITKIEKHGCFVRSELGLELGDEADSVYHVGQVVKCRIISCATSSRRISVSFVISTKRTSDDGSVKMGCVVSGVVERLTPTAVIVSLTKNGYLKGTIFNDHLADHHAQATLLRSLLRPGYEFDQLMVLDSEGTSLILSAKHSLISSAMKIPSDLAQIHPLTVVYGYICNIIESGCFVRFLGRLTGFAPKNMATDEMIDNILDAFYIGQTVRSHIVNVNSEAGRVKLSLKQSLCLSSDVSFIKGYFLLEEKIAAIQMSDVKDFDLSWVKDFNIGSLVEGEIQEIKELGVVLGFKNHHDVVGFVAHHQLGCVNVELGSVVTALVLDIAKLDGLVDLSLKPELVGSASTKDTKKKRRRNTSVDLKLYQTVKAVVEIVKENYLVLSVPEYKNAIGYASTTDYNIQKLPRKHFVNGQSVIATLGEISSSGRLLFILNSLTDGLETPNSTRAQRKSTYTVGSLVEAEVIDIKPLELILKFGFGFYGRIHITEVFDDRDLMENPFTKFRVGQLLNARIVAKGGHSGKGAKRRCWELSIRPSLTAGSEEAVTTCVSEELNFSVGENVRGYVVKVDSEWVWSSVSRSVMAHLYILDSSCEPHELQKFQQCYSMGQAVKGRILSINKEKKLLRLASCPSFDEIGDKSSQKIGASTVNDGQQFSSGDIVGGRIKKILPSVGGLLVQIGPHLFGRVHYTELVDEWVPHPISKYQEGQFVKCKILEISRSSEGILHVDLSLRDSVITNELVSCSKRFEKIDDLHPDMNIQGYVKNITSKGCFISLSRMMDARILVSNLSYAYVDSPEKEFPVGKLVHAKVLSVEPLSNRVEATLKTGNKAETVKSVADAFVNLHVGDIVTGHIRRIESYGLFITLDKANVVGLCHISKLSDEHIDNIEASYATGDKVVSKILKIDEERQRISLGMKKSYIENASGVDQSHVINDSHDHDESDSASMDTELLDLLHNDDLIKHQTMLGHDNAGFEILTPSGRSSSVSLEDSDVSDLENPSIAGQGSANENKQAAKRDRCIQKKAKDEKELEIIAAEERRLQNDMPRTEDEFEKLVRSSPNSSFVWIKYMAYMLSLAEIEKARNIAERALRTININEEGEKLNIWVAYFNLENEHGSPPEDAVKKIFQRALQYCDPKKLHLALLGVYERSEQQNLAEELLERMTKKFKHSCKVWMHCIQSFLKKDKDGIQLRVNRALISLPRKKHIKFISQTALLEFKSGVPDRGRSMFESILREYPKRTDLWSIYLDQEIRLGDAEVIRALFERATCLSLPPKKMKFLFKKYLDYEKAHGDEDTIEHVKQKALEYVESSLA
ncbi:Suppressor of forked protein (Suf) [Musa troglodytarum]|uniref:Protein RRP5 homolog n=1 Tax=Musa troglodytarum TaxID=320322 RepID=A0A9E7GRX0_9LILI|nr:Suppressor of forked protein (Suf) [Musa troglodytarum]